MLVFMDFKLMRRVFMLMETMIAGVAMIMDVDIPDMLMRVGMFMEMFMGMGMLMFMAVNHIPVSVLMGMRMGMLVSMQVFVFMSSFHYFFLPS